ncbi:hypothetical protein AbraIFM66950_009184 [Aspergillus brasiliensis]|nr:hypothetical protein AbraIFM66950_009184 [Aspergillus brasiliensis]
MQGIDAMGPIFPGSDDDFPPPVWLTLALSSHIWIPPRQGWATHESGRLSSVHAGAEARIDSPIGNQTEYKSSVYHGHLTRGTTATR